ncbi:unnamed protein product [Trifolium pratense]|uniref:Uncharacterized protein n=1 Tax=Trifolium pratense TaxID=57577 RepID=A0ACB0M1B5_TRIPR|nr:unnamed protein product [Trifolium pratense]
MDLMPFKLQVLFLLAFTKKPKMPSLTLFMVVLSLILIFPYNNVYGDEQQQQQSCLRRCGVHNISHPFWLKDSPKKCGDKRYMLSCEDNNQLILYCDSGKYYVQSINYNNFTIRLLDFNHLGSSNYSLLPPYPLGFYNFTAFRYGSLRYIGYMYGYKLLVKPVLYVRCPNYVQPSGIYFDATCINISSYAQQGNNYIGYGYDKSLSEMGIGDGCRVEFMYLSSWPMEHDGRHGNNNISCSDIHRMMYYGFELSWINSLCKDGWYVMFDQYNQTHCVQDYRVPLGLIVGPLSTYIIVFFSIGKFVLGAPFIMAFLIFKWRQKHLSMYDGIENFLRSDNSIMPIRYSYKDIKKITEQFKTKLGSGGYGSVFKGQLRSDRLVAVKLLDNGKSNGQDFVNEVATIGRIYHVNVVQLIGFCVEGSKRALIYEFMPKGSLEKYIFSHTEESNSLSCEKLYDISLGVARGIEYLHNGCNMKILHFDIKPHNILLDENFNPKVSDFGLARLCPTDKSIVSLTAARGTIGYMAPELFYRNVGTISYKADVYSFGMLLMEMANRRKNLNALAEQSSQIYIPFWVYDQLKEGREITIENDTNQEMKLAKKMMIVALWCIQTKPSDRPSMDKVIEMLEEEDSDLQMPNKSYLYAQDLPAEDVRDDSSGSTWSSSSTSITYSNEAT